MGDVVDFKTGNKIKRKKTSEEIDELKRFAAKLCKQLNMNEEKNNG